VRSRKDKTDDVGCLPRVSTGKRVGNGRLAWGQNAATIYFLQCNGAEGPIKIGQAKYIEKRVSELQIGCPYPLLLIGHAWFEDADTAEQEIHEVFRQHRMQGEWFRCCPEIVQAARLLNKARTDFVASSSRGRQIAHPTKARRTNERSQETSRNGREHRRVSRKCPGAGHPPVRLPVASALRSWWGMLPL
jgi:hypothetical protein